ncbi:MAG TPA: hypothetical protein DCZ92_06820 [Elusimicrobia bacterium]|nr:MAG: hypothetical protein A2016_05145 [Elusimicrobia bacterium GWF2_62_30]HBA60518.1 hypothetical protein [Elusimicrobiota bacterium]
MSLTTIKKDAEVITAVRNGDKEEFSILVRRYQARIIAFCFSMLAEREAARDAAQEIFIKAFKGLDNFHGSASFSTWLYKIAYNHCCTLLQHKRIAITESLDGMSMPEREAAEKRLCTEKPAGEDISQLTTEALNSLPAGYRAAISLRLQGADYQTIAASLEISVDSVKARLRRARIILRARLRHFLPGGRSIPMEAQQ